MPKSQPKRTKVRSSRKARPASEQDAAMTPYQQKIGDTIQKHWELGQKIDLFCRSGSGRTIADFANENRMPERTVRTYCTFYRLYDETELEKLCSIRRADSDLPLTSGHVTYLLTIKDSVSGYGKTAASARLKFATEAAEKNYTPAQLNAAIRRACGRESSNKGRPLAVPESDLAVRQVVEEAIAWSKRCRTTWETLTIRTPKPTKECQQLRKLLAACREYCIAAEAVLDARGNVALEKMTEVVERAQQKMGKLSEV